MASTFADEPKLVETGATLEEGGWPRLALAILRRRWWVVLGCLAVVVLLTILYLRGASYTYTATLRTTAASSTAGDTGRLGQFGQLASLAGIGGAEERATPFNLYLEGLYTREVADRLARDRRLMRAVFKGEWDPMRGGWQRPSSLIGNLRRGLFDVLGVPQPAWRPPGGERLQEHIAAGVVVARNIRSPLVAITYNHEDPRFAVRFLTVLHETTDRYLREKSAARARENIAYLSSKLRVVTLAEQRAALFASLSAEERDLMLADASAPYAADPFGEVTASNAPTQPRPLLLLAGASVAGVVVGVALALLLGLPRRRAAPEAS